MRGKDEQINAVLQIIAAADADVLALQGIDYDLTGAVLGRLAEATGYPHSFALRPNTGLPTGLDMDGDGRRGGPRDAQGYGRFSGQGGMAVLSRFPMDTAQVQDLSALLWQDVPDALLPEVNGKPFPSAKARAVQRLSTTGHWVIPILLPEGRVDLMTFHASPPVFDGP
ncbi:MAG: endonuclease/exonuclease/phosphatase family protein, partial [Pseudomonadota bacterium]